MRGCVWIVCWMLAWGSLTSCDTVELAETQITVRTNAERDLQDQLTLLRVSVSLREVEGWKTPVLAEIGRAQLRWPVDIPVTPRSSGDDDKQFEVVVEAVSNRRVLAQARAVTRFEAGSRRVLELVLRSCPEAVDGACAPPDCRGEACKTCNAERTCAPTGITEPDTLPPLVGAGMDAGMETTASFDGSAGETGSPEADAEAPDDVGALDAAATLDAGADARFTTDAASDSATRADVGTGVPDVGTRIPDVGTGAPDVGTGGVCDSCPTGWACAPSGTRCARSDLDKGDGTDVITLGDSWMTLFNSGIQVGLAKASMQSYRNYAVVGTNVLSGQIPGQFNSAKTQDPDIKTVVMTGGMDDIWPVVNTDCATGGPTCAARLDMIEKALDALWKQMSESGVMDVVYVLRSKKTTDMTPIQGLPAHTERLRQLCASHAPMRCFQVNTDALATTLQADGIHPTEAECDAIGRAVFVLMGQEGLRR